MKKSLAALGAGTLAALAAPATAHATTAHAQTCGAVVRDHITKTDSGHGTPAEWADLSLKRTTTVRCAGDGKYAVTLVDHGTLRTRPGAGTPNGTGGQIEHAVPGTVSGVYHLTVDGQLAVPAHRDTTLSSTAYVQQLFATGAQIRGGAYAWAYKTGCEHWVDSSTNNDGQGEKAGNITGQTCKPRSHPGTPTATPTSSSGTPSSTPTTVPIGAPQTGDGSSPGGHNTALMAAGGLMVVMAAGAGGWLMLRRRGQHH